MTVKGTERSYDQKWNFRVEFEGIDDSWFTTCSGLEGEISVVEQEEGGAITTASKDPGKVKYPPITLTIGVTESDQLFRWWQRLGGSGVAVDPDSVGDAEKKSGAIIQLERDGSEKRRYPLEKAWISKYKVGDWDAKNETDNVMEEITIVYTRFDRENASAS